MNALGLRVIAVAAVLIGWSNSGFAQELIGRSATYGPAALAPMTRPVRVLYAIPQDCSFRDDYSAAIRYAMLDLRSWYRDQLSGHTFSLPVVLPEVCRLANAESHYLVDTWSKVLTDVQSCAPVSHGTSTVWVVYADVNHTCNAPGRLGAGALGLTMMGRHDLDGLIGERTFSDCGEELRYPLGRWIGGAGHELGHAFGLPHPAACQANLPTCDWGALMFTGYIPYPATYLRADEKQFLLSGDGCFFTLSATSGAVGPGGATASSIGVVASAAGCTWTATSNASFITLTGGAGGTGNGTVTYAVSALASGTRTGTLTIAGHTFTLSQGPTMTLDQTTVSFGAVNNGVLSNATSAQTIRVSFAGVSPGWTAQLSSLASSVPWLRITGGSGTGNGQFTVSTVNAAGLPSSGTLIAKIQVTGAGAHNSPQVVSVRLTLLQNSFLNAEPYGSFDTPLTGATGLQGSIAVTGWALDDSEVTRVEIWRDHVGAEPFYSGPGPGNGKVFIANALFIGGARPDVETAYPNSPFASRAGWGYLLLTWGLANQGNGTYNLYAFAYDADGHATTLGGGARTISVSNAQGTRPFGGIDTPTYGQTVTGSFWNYGWTLTPNANAADLRSCTIMSGSVMVSVDSGPLQAVTYSGARSDIAASFPGFSNGANAGGAYYLDVSSLADGTHSIGWLVTDNCGRTDGIGSRFFAIAKSSPN